MHKVSIASAAIEQIVLTDIFIILLPTYAYYDFTIPCAQVFFFKEPRLGFCKGIQIIIDSRSLIWKCYFLVNEQGHLIVIASLNYTL